MWLIVLLLVFARTKDTLEELYELYDSDSLDEIQVGEDLDSAELSSVDDLFQQDPPEFDPYMADDSSEDSDEVAVGQRFFRSVHGNTRVRTR